MSYEYNEKNEWREKVKNKQEHKSGTLTDNEDDKQRQYL